MQPSTRREFLAAMAHTGGKLAIASPAARAGRDKKEVSVTAKRGPGRELGFYVNLADPKLGERLAWLRERGVGCIGTDGMRGNDPELIRRVGALFRHNEMTVESAHAEPGLVASGEDAERLWKAYRGVLDRAAAWGARCVVCHFRQLAIPWREGVHWDETAFISRVGLDEYDRRMAVWWVGCAMRRRAGTSL